MLRMLLIHELQEEKLLKHLSLILFCLPLVMWACQDPVSTPPYDTHVTNDLGGDASTAPQDLRFSLPDSATPKDNNPTLDAKGPDLVSVVDATPSFSGVRYVRITTNSSPSWVSWAEVVVVGSWADGSFASSNLALGKEAFASSVEPGSQASNVVDGDAGTAWNAGDFPPASITIDLQDLANIERVELLVNQMPAGFTEHVIEFGDSQENFTHAHTFAGATEVGQWLTFETGFTPVVEPPVEGDAMKWHRKVLSFSKPSHEGNPFELDFSVTFVHEQTSDSLTLPGFYAGGEMWKVGFMPTRTGTWNWTSNSSDSDLNGLSGSVVVASSGHPGLLRAAAGHPNKWRYEDGDYVVPIGIFANAMLDDASMDQFIAMADFMQANNIAILNFRISEHDKAFQDVGQRTMNLDLWDRLEARMDVLAERGLGVDIMLYTDDAGTPSFGPQSAAEQLLIRYTVARLSGYPVVLFNTGIDLAEYRDQAWVDWFGQQVKSLDPYGHPVSSRYGGGSGMLKMNGQTYNSVGARNSTMSDLLAAFDLGDGVPAANNDNWSEDMEGLNGHTVADIRRGAWKATVAGGVAIHIRNNVLFCPGGITECDRYFHIATIQEEIESEGYLRLINPFIRDHLGETFGAMVPAPSLIGPGGAKYALADPARDRILILLVGQQDSWDPGDGGAVEARLQGLNGSYSASWFDPRAGTVSSAGTLNAGQSHVMAPPNTDDWILLLKKN